jgi:chorismate mutase
MGLAEVREKINEVDAELMALLDKRAECSVRVAAAKLGSGDLIYKPGREREICDKFSDVGKGMGENVAKTIMRNSRLIQYEMYADEGIVPEKFLELIKNVGNGMFSGFCRNADSGVQTAGGDKAEKNQESADTALALEKEAGSDIKLDLKIDFEENNKNKLGKSDILLILSESGFEITKLDVDEDNIKVKLLVGSTAADCKRAYILLFMLYMETVSLEVE